MDGRFNNWIGWCFGSDVSFVVWNTLFAEYSFLFIGTYGLTSDLYVGPAGIAEQGRASMLSVYGGL